ncbi:gamma-glutamylcyclotransferase family protein [Halomonas sp. E14]|uniref:gamma-glutamylcyclotransferase family protein n=1 Tax=Halomonas sp. E14 TaxID=3397245 RepID=UPI00403E46C7
MRPRPRDIVLSLLVLLLGALSWLWLTMLSPFTYDRPAHLPEVDEGPHAVFVYGTLRLAPVRWLVMGRAGETEPAVLAGFRRDGLDLVEAPGERTAGELVIVSAEELEQLDRYERLGIRYQRVPLQLADGRTAWVYRRLNDAEAPAGEGAGG